MSSKEDVMRMGNMLLEGWKMLGEGCPLCATAIMAKGGVMRCPKCDLPIVLEKNMDANQKVFLENPVESSGERNSPPSTPVTSFQSLEEAKKEYDQRNRRNQDIVSDLIGQYMLKGWTLLSAECPKCMSTPLMSQKDGPKFCVFCKEHVKESDDQPDEKPSQNYPKEELSDRFDMSQIPELDADTGKPLDSKNKQQLQNNAMSKENIDFVDKWSQEISSKLLCGWVLLNDVCDRSGGCDGDLPLLKDLAGEIYCVKCGYDNQEASVKLSDNNDGSEDDIDDDDDDLNDEMAIKIQRMAAKSFENATLNNETNPKASSDAKNDSSVPSLRDCDHTAISSSHLKNDICSHIDKKLRKTAALLNMENSSNKDAIELANLITALAGARNAVNLM